MITKNWLCLVFVSLILVAGKPITAQQCISTFESIGIYWSPVSGASNNECTVSYRLIGQSEWKGALPLWYDDRDQQYRGSIVNLKPGSKYEIKLTLQQNGQTVSFNQATWSENLPIARTIYVPKSAETFVVNESGSKEGYVLYLPEDDQALIDVCHQRDYALEVAKQTSYVIIRGLTLQGANQSGIRIYNNCHNVVIEQNDISDWGTEASDGWGLGDQAAIFSKNAPNVKRIVIQNNKLHHPKSDANSWAEYREIRDTYHPGGPKGILLHNTNGNHVIRYNRIYSDDDHYFVDGIGGGANFSNIGFPNKDSDIYENYIERCWDDGIESEGGNQNVRIWGNIIDKTYVKIAIAATANGPLYIWRNLALTSRKSALESNPNKYGRGPFIKAGGNTRKGTWYGSGRTYIFHNTVVQSPNQSGFPLGCGSGIRASGGKLYNVVSRNNIFTTYKNGSAAVSDETNSCTNDFDYDMYNGVLKSNCNENPHQQHGIKLIKELPQFEVKDQFKYFLKKGSPGYDMGVILPNFNDDFKGDAPDMGAFE